MSEVENDVEPVVPIPYGSRSPVVGDSVICRENTAQVVRVHGPSDGHSALDLVIYRDEIPEVKARVVHDLENGWHWLGELPPPDPTPEDRVRAAIAAGRRVPALGSVVTRIEALPRSFRGVELVGHRARVVAIRDVVEGKILIDVQILANAVAPEDPLGFDPPIDADGVETVLGPMTLEAGWGENGWYARSIASPQHDLARRPCDRCGQPPDSSHHIQFFAVDTCPANPGRRINVSHFNQSFAVLCRPCADEISRSFFVPPPQPAAEADRDAFSVGETRDLESA